MVRIGQNIDFSKIESISGKKGFLSKIDWKIWVMIGVLLLLLLKGILKIGVFIAIVVGLLIIFRKREKFEGHKGKKKKFTKSRKEILVKV